MKNENFERMNLKSGFEKWLLKEGKKVRKKDTAKKYLSDLSCLIEFLNVTEDDFYKKSWFKVKCLSFKLESSRPFLSLSKSCSNEYGVALRSYLRYVKYVESIDKRQPAVIEMSQPVELKMAG